MMNYQLWLLLLAIASTSSYKLPASVIPQHYKLSIIASLDGEYYFEGDVLIKVKCLLPTNNITLHALDLKINHTEVTLTPVHDETDEHHHHAHSIPITKSYLEPINDFYIVEFEKPLSQDHEYELRIPFRGVLTDGLAGFYRSKYQDSKTGETKWLAVTQFEPTDARRAFPCFDEPAMKAVFGISIGHRDNYTSISNMRKVKTEPISTMPGWVFDHYEDSVKMSTYLIAYVVSDFDYKTSPSEIANNNVTFKIWARKDAINQVNYAVDVGPKYLKYYEDFFNISYPLPKQDMIALPDFSAGAMENWGLITYRETALLYDPNISSASSLHRVASVIAHELAHQWFGNLVTMKWWTDLWLNEGFATYMASRAVHHFNPEWNSFNEEAQNNILSVFALDSLKSSHPISVPIGHPSEISQIFDTISYKKGSSILRMMNLFLGEDVFRNGVSNYLNKYAYGNAEQDDLWNSLTEEAHAREILQKNITVKKIMDTWTLQTGYPLVTVTRNYKNNTATITQKRYFTDVITTKSLNEACWWVPLSYTSESENNFNNTKPKHWLNCDDNKKEYKIKLPEKDEWVLFNVKMAGFYKVNYDVKNWELLTKFLQEKDFTQIPTINRVQLITDSFDLAATGDLDYEIALELLTYIVKDTEYLPWDTALSRLGTINRRVKRTPIYGLFKKYVQNLLLPIYKQIVDFNIPASNKVENLDEIKHKVLITSWACKFDVGDCRQQAKKLFDTWSHLENPDKENPIPKDLRGTVYCNVLRESDENTWNFLWQRYLHSNVGSEKNTILSALGCTEEIWLLNRYLEWSINETSEIRRQDSSLVFGAVAYNQIGFYVAKDFLKTRIEDIHEYLGPKSERLARYISVLASQMIRKDELEELEEMTQENARCLVSSKLGVQQSIEKVQVNIQWHSMHYDNIKNLLLKYIR